MKKHYPSIVEAQKILMFNGVKLKHIYEIIGHHFRLGP